CANPTMSAAQSASDDAPESSGRLAYERELYWASQPAPPADVSIAGLKESWAELADRLRTDANAPEPQMDPALLTGTGLRRRLKQTVWRIFRPVGRRYDRAGAEIAELGAI